MDRERCEEATQRCDFFAISESIKCLEVDDGCIDGFGSRRFNCFGQELTHRSPEGLRLDIQADLLEI